MSVSAQQVEDLLNEYVHALDDGRIEQWPDFFSEDAVYQVTTRENMEAGYPLGIVYCEGRGMMLDRVEALRKANVFEGHTYCHLIGRPALTEADDGSYVARTNFSVLRTMDDGAAAIFASGKYLDRIALVGGTPRFRERRVVLDSRRIDILLVYPL